MDADLSPCGDTEVDDTSGSELDLSLTRDITVATCRPHHVAGGRLNTDSALAYFAACNVDVRGCRLAMGEDERGFFVHLWKRIFRKPSSLETGAGRVVWKRKVNADEANNAALTGHASIDLCHADQDSTGWIDVGNIPLRAPQRRVEAGSPLLGRPTLFRVDMPTFTRQVEAP